MRQKQISLKYSLFRRCRFFDGPTEARRAPNDAPLRTMSPIKWSEKDFHMTDSGLHFARSNLKVTVDLLKTKTEFRHCGNDNNVNANSTNAGGTMLTEI